MTEPRREDDSSKEQEKVKKTLFSELSRLFGAIAELVTEEAKSPSLKGAHITHVHRKTKELLGNADRVAKGLQLFKEELIRDFGSASHAFILKSIDPMIVDALRVIEELSLERKGIEQTASDIRVRAVQTAQLFSQFSDEKKLRRKIMAEAIRATQCAIEKDCQMLRHYQYHTLEEISVPQLTDIRELEKKLEPIFNEFAELALKRVATDDLRQFFMWKSHIDERRAVLVEIGLLTIDTALKKRVSIDSSEEEREEGALYSEIEENMAENFKELSILNAIEERALKLFEILTSSTVFNQEMYFELEQLLEELKKEAKGFENHLHLQHVFRTVLKQIEKTEHVLSSRQEADFNNQEPPEADWHS